MIFRSLLSATLLLSLAAFAYADPPQPGLRDCAPGLGAEQQRKCDEAALKQIEADSQSVSLENGWRFVRTRHPSGGADSISVMHVADITKSDPGLAGLALQCGATGIDVALIMLQPLQRNARPLVSLTSGTTSFRFQAIAAASGAALMLPQDASRLAAGEWQRVGELAIDVEAQPEPIRGAISVGGLGAALRYLSSNCPAR
jgi:hypothetical protein